MCLGCVSSISLSLTALRQGLSLTLLRLGWLTSPGVRLSPLPSILVTGTHSQACLTWLRVLSQGFILTQKSPYPEPSPQPHAYLVVCLVGFCVVVLVF